MLGGMLPTVCAFCHCWPVWSTTGRVCADCLGRFLHPEPACPHCALPVPAGTGVCGACLLQPPPLHHCVAAVPYAYPWNQAIAAFKFHGDTGWATALARIMWRHPATPALLQQAQVLLPVPLSASRWRERGYNQSLLLARPLRHQLVQHTPSCPPLLLTHGIDRQDTPRHQTGMRRNQRLRHWDGTFTLTAAAMQHVHGQHVLLIDDVMTTGATLHALAQTCLHAGASRVCALVFARTPAP